MKLSKRQKLVIYPAALLAGFTLSACAKSVDVEATGARQVPGVSNLYSFCDGSTAIYFSKMPGESDQYEYIVYDSEFCVEPGNAPAPRPRAEAIPDDES